jgi:hypothetical protein
MWKELDESFEPTYNVTVRAYAFSNDSVGYDEDLPYGNDADANFWDEPEYLFSGTLKDCINQLNTIAKTHRIVMLEIASSNNDTVFFASNTDPDNYAEYDDITVFENSIIPESEPFMKQFKIDARAHYYADKPTSPMYIIAPNGNAGGNIYYMGRDLANAMAQYKKDARDFVKYGMGGGDTTLELYEYKGDPKLFETVYADWAADGDTNFDVNIEELGFDLSDCILLNRLHEELKLAEAAESDKISAKSECVYLIRHEDGKRYVAVKRDENNNVKSVYVNGKAFLDSICYFNTRDEAIKYMNKVAKKLPYEDTLLKIVKAKADLNGYLEVDTKFGKCLIKASTLN